MIEVTINGGKIFLEDSINEPLLISQNSNIISCLSNVCTHRGSLLCKKNTNSGPIQIR